MTDQSIHDEMMGWPATLKTKGKSRRVLPAKRLKDDTLKAMRAFANTVGVGLEITPVFVGRVKAMSGEEYSVGKKSSADLIACFGGRYMDIEIKAGNDSMSTGQKQRRERIFKAGGFYVLVRRPQDALDAMARVVNLIQGVKAKCCTS